MAAEWTTGILEGMLAAQWALRDGLHALGLTAEVAGQPQWPFAHRLAAEMMWIDPGHARRVAITGLCVLAAVLLLLTGALLALVRRPLWLRTRRRAQLGLVIAALALLAFAPWPQSHLLWAQASPTSLHRSASDFSPHNILQGQALYQQHCVQCHGADARGEGPLASTLGRWPPNLTGGLLWKRLEGELFWHVRHGMRDERSGRETMPGVAEAAMSDTDIWKVLDFLQAYAAGQTLRSMGVWERPVRLPRFALQCRYGEVRDSSRLIGQRLLLVLPSPDGLPQTAPAEDPRLVTVMAQRSASVSDPECVADDAQLLPVLAMLLGENERSARGTQLLVDRDGWLRARAKPGLASWSEDDLICRTDVSGVTTAKVQTGDVAQGLDALLRRMDSEPVRLVRAGFPH